MKQFRDLRLNDPVIDSKGRPSKVYDIDRNIRSVITDKHSRKWRDFHEVELPQPEKQTI